MKTSQTGTLLFVTAVATAVVLSGVVPLVAADEHTYDEARDLSDKADVTVTLPTSTDHQPGSQNQQNGSLQGSAVGKEAFDEFVEGEVSNDDGAFIDYVIIKAAWVDFSNCDVGNVNVFGIDRGNDDPGAEIDENLVPKHKRVDFNDGSVVIEFANFEDLSNDPPYGEANDEIVAGLGAGSNDGPCATMTDEPGWYQLTGFINGTEADNGEDEQPSEDARTAGIKAHSNYVYVCDCENGQEAREQLGPPPNESDPTPTPTPTADTPTPTPEASTETPAAATATPTNSGNTGGTAPTATPADAEPVEETSGGADETTPTLGNGAGFGSLLAIVALLATALLVRRSR